MKRIPCFLLALGVAVLPLQDSFAAVLTFDDLLGVPPPDQNDFINLDNAVDLTFPGQDRYVYGGVRWSFAAVAPSHLVARHNHSSDYWGSDGTGPFATPHSGSNALFVPFGQPLSLETDQILTGVWVARPNLGPTGVGGAERLTVTAWAGTNPVGSVSLDLTRTGTTPVLLDTSSFLFLSGITGYVVAPEQPGLDSGYFIADDFQFAPASLAELCPCDALWRNHSKYVRCVREAASLLREDHALTDEQVSTIIHAAQKSDCGTKHPRSR